MSAATVLSHLVLSVTRLLKRRRGDSSSVCEPIVGPSWAATVPELEDVFEYGLPDDVVAVLQWDDGEGIADLPGWLDIQFYEADGYPTNAAWALPANAPEASLMEWTRVYLEYKVPTGHFRFERRHVLWRYGSSEWKRYAVLLVVAK